VISKVFILNALAIYCTTATNTNNPKNTTNQPTNRSNKMSLLKSLTTEQDIRQIITGDYEKTTFDKMCDLQAEITESILPIYYGDIIGEWQAMPNEYDNAGVIEYGLPEPEKITVYKLMELDLYHYYSDLVAKVLWALQDEGYFDEEQAE
jgi:hypothetical protein